MCLFSLASIERDLDRSVHSPSCEATFLQLAARLPAQYSSTLAGWPNARAELEQAGFKSEASDPLLRSIIQEYQVAGGEVWATVSLYLFWRPLLQIHRGLGRLDQPDLLFSQIHWSFLQALHRIDLAERECRFGQKLLNDTQHDTRRWYADERAKHPQLTFDDPDDDPAEDVPSRCLDIAMGERSVERSWALTRLRALVQTGSLTRSDYQILLGCHLYGRSIEQMAIHLGVPYGVAKKRRQRAAKKLQKSAPHLSPGDPDSPLYPVERSPRKEVGDADELYVPRRGE